MIVTPETGRLDVEHRIQPPMQLAVTIPLAVDGRHSMHDRFVVYVVLGGFARPARDAPMVIAAMGKAIAEHLKSLPPFEV